MGTVSAFLLLSCVVLLVSFLPSLNDVSQRLLFLRSSHTDWPRTARKLQQIDQKNQAQHVDSSWTHPPVCSPYIEALTSPLCIYTTSTFGNNTGVSIFTTPSIASTLTGLPILRPDASLSQDQSAPSPFHVAAIPRKGHGLIATRSINRHSLILRTHPVLVTLIEEVLSTEEREHYFRLAISQLSPSTQNSYYDLVRLYNIEDFAAQDVVRANSFEIGLSWPSASEPIKPGNDTPKHTVLSSDGSRTTMHAAVFPEAARLNHACHPNAMYYLDPYTLTHVVHATRDIQPGEEITISYISVMQNLEARRRMLAEGFGFKCLCERCVKEEEHSRHEGGALEGIGSHRAWLVIYVLDESIPGWEDIAIQESHVDEILTRYLGLFEEEGLQGFMDEAYQIAAVTEWKLKRKDKAREYGRNASKVMAIRYGESHADIKSWRAIGDHGVKMFLQELRADLKMEATT